MGWKVFNDNGVVSTTSVIEHKWGKEGVRYIKDLINTLQSREQVKSDTVSKTVDKVMSNYISAVFGANPSIVLKQLGSIPLAGAYLGVNTLPSAYQIKHIDRELIAKYTSDLAWRTMGYSIPETKTLKDNPNHWSQKNKFLRDWVGGGAITKMDAWAASVLWPWAENKVHREFPDLDVGTQEQIDKGESPFFRKVAEVFEDALARSQSTTDVIHQGTLRRSKNPATRAFTMFRSDSAQTYNTIRQKIGEARFYMRTKATKDVVRSARKAAGAAFLALLVNALWAEGIDFLMALWKNKGKYYRDDEDELTFGSVAGEMVSGVVGSFAGIVAGGEEIVDAIGNIITGDKWWGVDAPGMEQLNDAVEAIANTMGGMRGVMSGALNVLVNGGNLGQYFGDHAGEIAGYVKKLAETAATYLAGIPVKNLEAYLMGAVKWLSPTLGAAYDDLFKEVGKGDLSGLEGDVLEYRIENILHDKGATESEETVKAIAELYEAGYMEAVPSDTPSEVTINGEEYALGEYQKQVYDSVWGETVAGALDELISSDAFLDASPNAQEKMLKNLYSYAAEKAKAELFDEFEMSSKGRYVRRLVYRA